MERLRLGTYQIKSAKKDHFKFLWDIYFNEKIENIFFNNSGIKYFLLFSL